MNTNEQITDSKNEQEEFDKFMRQSSDSHYVLHNNTNGEHISIDIQNPHNIDDLIKMIKSNDNLQIILLTVEL